MPFSPIFVKKIRGTPRDTIGGNDVFGIFCEKVCHHRPGALPPDPRRGETPRTPPLFCKYAFFRKKEKPAAGADFFLGLFHLEGLRGSWGAEISVDRRRIEFWVGCISFNSKDPISNQKKTTQKIEKQPTKNPGFFPTRIWGPVFFT